MRRLYFDLEVSPDVVLSWRTGSKLFIGPDAIVRERAIICACWTWNDEDKIHSLQWDNGDDKQLVIDLAKVMNEADEIVAHFGDRFDIPWLKGRNLIHGLPPLPLYKSVDTYKLAKRNFYLNSYKLDYLGKILLDEGKIDVPYSLWKRITLDNEPSALKDMVTYCKQDIVLLRKVYKELSAYDAPKSHTGVMNGLERWSCPHCGSEDVKVSKTRVTPRGMIQKQMQCGGCHRYYSIAHKVWRDYLVAKAREE